MKRLHIVTALILACAALARPGGAAVFRPMTTALPGSVPLTINYQGRLDQNGNPQNGTVNMVFTIYDALTAGTIVWGPYEVSGGVAVNSGLFNVQLPVPPEALYGGGKGRWLDVQVGPLTGGSVTEMSPREQLNAVPYALVAKSLEGTIDVSSGGFVVGGSSAPTPAQTFLYVSSVTGKVGIGTQTPGYALDVQAGDVNAAVNLREAGATLASKYAQLGAANTFPQTQSFTAGNNTTFSILASSGIQVGAGGVTAPYVLAGSSLILSGTGASIYFTGAASAATYSIVTSSGIYVGGTGGVTAPFFSGAFVGTMNGNATSATNLAGGLANEIPYQTGAGATTFTGQPGANSVLFANSGAPAWSNAPTLNSLTLTSPLVTASGGTGANLGAGASGGIPYFSAAGVMGSSLLLTAHGVVVGGGAGTAPKTTAVGAANTVLVGNAGADPSFSATPSLTSLALTTALTAASGGTGANLSGGVSGAIPYFSAAGVLGASALLNAHGVMLAEGAGTAPTATAAGTANQLLKSGGGADPSWTTATYPSDITAGDLLYGSAAHAVSALGIGANGTVLQVGGGALGWAALNATTVGLANNLTGGAQGSLPYQSGANATAMLAKNATATRYVANTGAGNDPAWDQIDLTNGVKNRLPVGNGGTGLATLTAHGVVVGEGASDVAVTAAGGTGTVLVGNAGADPSFSSSPSLTSLAVTSFIQLQSQNKAYFRINAPAAVGQMYYCIDCGPIGAVGPGMLIISTGTAIAQWANGAGGDWDH